MKKIYNKSMAKYLARIFLTILVILTLLYGLKGIATNHSFWSDEAYISSIARDVATGKKPMTVALKMPGAVYQPLHTLIIASSFKVFGVSEKTARLPSVLFGAVGVIFAFLLARKLSNSSGGVLGAFLYAFSQINLANFTQAKPYTALSLCLLIVLFCISVLSDKKNNRYQYLHLVVILVSIAAYFLNPLGVLYFIPYLSFLLISQRHNIQRNSKKPIFLLGLAIIILTAIFVFHLNTLVGNLLYTSGSYNNISYLRELLWRNYGFITLPALFGMIFAYKKNNVVVLSITVYLFVLLTLWSFKEYSHNIRYIFPVFGILFIFFSIFWANVLEKFYSKKISIVLIASIIVLLYVGGNKIARKPSNYYSPNADMYGDVQNADYKTLYSQLQTQFPEIDKIAYFDDVVDNHSWYMKRIPDAYFTKFEKDGTKNKVNGVKVFSSLSAFLKEKSRYPKGVIVIEDWQSFTPDEIKQYVQKNLKLEIKVDSLPQSPGDKWPLEVYSWGI